MSPDNDDTQHPANIFFQDRPIFRLRQTGAKLIFPGPSRFLVQRTDDRWLPIAAAHIPQAIANNTLLGIWQDKRQQAPPDGKIDLNELSNLRIVDPDQLPPPGEGTTLISTPLRKKGTHQEPQWQKIDKDSWPSEKSIIAEWNDQPQLIAKDGLIQDNEVTPIEPSSTTLLLHPTSTIIQQLAEQLDRQHRKIQLNNA